jgi:hypothetical protein
MFDRKNLNKFTTGFLTGLFLPFLVFIIAWLVMGNGVSLAGFIDTIVTRNVLTHYISISVFPNVFAFLLFNRFDFLRSSKGILAITIIWALTTFIIKFT